ncbi:tudor domain-containing protein 7A isoform X2 [Austrofundulus limnaeus]|uniref:Tudor domain-containing protein 7A isoform X2 n=1 Tax=Austrofundulus limnaeus TaxID=52670 RepID=A0A2I4CG26_AUSLI|nr:PREDICTED: tudor domain-containing protein 7 isoform X2 [Austrofundulus limnaeus]
MLDSESIQKMLRSVLMSSKTGVSINNIQCEYRSFCGDMIPLRKLGFSTLEDYLRSIPSVVRLEYRMGELRCFASVSEETAHIAELVAKQKNSKKSGRSQVVNCKMRFKPSNPYMLNVTPRSSLRQPSAGRSSNWSRFHVVNRGSSAAGDFRQADHKLSSMTPVEHRDPPAQPAVKQNIIANRKTSPNLNNYSSDIHLEKVSASSESQNTLYDVELVQSRLKQLLEKYSSGLWVSKLPEVYNQMFGQKLHPQVLLNMEKWTDLCSMEKPSITNRADRLVYPPLPSKPLTSSFKNTVPSSGLRLDSTPVSSPPTTPEQNSEILSPFAVPKTRASPKSPLAMPTFIFPPPPASGHVSPPVTLQSPAHKPSLTPRFQSVSPAVNRKIGSKGDHNLSKVTQNRNTPSLAPTWSCLGSTDAAKKTSSIQPNQDILPLLKVTFSSAPCPPSKPAVVVSSEVRQKIKELLSKYSQGLWAHALPKLFMDAYKMQFPEQILDNLALLCDICTVEYPLPRDKKKAILYNSNRGDMNVTDSPEIQQCRSNPLPSGLEVVGSVVPPRLTLPSEQYPSVLVTEAKSSNAVTVRYVGENYSNTQEAMEDVMQTFYSKNKQTVTNPVIGQLVAVRGEDGEEMARAQVMDVTNPDKIKVFYVDYGFSVETSVANLHELHQDFLSLPFQATNVRLAGLEAFSSHSLLLSLLDKLAVGKILLMETLPSCPQNEMPQAVLYDTSQDEDININTLCLKSLWDMTMNNPLSLNVTYQDVCISSVCADGTIFCQLPSRGTARLRKLLEEVDAYFTSQMAFESLVSRPFTGKFCLACYKGKWARAELTNMYGNRVMEILFMDFGVSATVEVTDLREIPLLFLKALVVIPPQTIKCQLADITVPGGGWSHETILWLNEAMLGKEDCKMKISNLKEYKGEKVVCMYLFVGGDGQELHESINHQLAQWELRQKLTTDSSIVDTGHTSMVERLTLKSSFPNPVNNTSQLREKEVHAPIKTETQPLSWPPLLNLPQPGQNMDVFVPVVCHPGYFVVQLWQSLHKLVVLMGEMVLHYNQMENTSRAVNIQKGEVYAAKIDKNWHRVQVKAVLANGLVNVYELDYGKHELVHSTVIQPLIEEFRQLPFQAVAAQLAGVEHRHWSEEASMLFRSHVEKKALVAQVESVRDVSEIKGELWERRLTVYLVDTSLKEDLWIHSIMADIRDLSSAA